jgi:hypothetical protein
MKVSKPNHVNNANALLDDNPRDKQADASSPNHYAQ